VYKDAVAIIADKTATMAGRIKTEINLTAKRPKSKKTNSVGDKAMLWVHINFVHV